MSKNIDLREDSIKSIFIKYLIPAIAGMVVKSLYITTDAVFIGRGVGSLGLAGVNLIIPLFSFFSAVAILFGIGGATVVSIEFGKGNKEKAIEAFSGNIIMLTIIMAIVAIVGSLYIDELVSLLGATESIFPYTKSYLFILLKFSIVFALGQGLSCFVRNDANPKLAMYSLIFSAVLNCILDYIFIFIFNWGIEGAALATGISHVTACVVLLVHFVFKKGKLRFKFQIIDTQLVRSIRNGVPNFFAEISIGITTLAFNKVIISLLGEQGITAYSIVMGAGPIFTMTFMGISQALQPIISFNYGANKISRVKESLNLGIKASLGVGIVFFILALILGENIVRLFNNTDNTLITYTVTALRKYFSAFLFMGVNIVIITYFQAIEKSRLSTILSMLRGFILVLICIFIVPYIFGKEALWYSVTLAEVLTIIVSIYHVRKEMINFKEIDTKKVENDAVNC